MQLSMLPPALLALLPLASAGYSYGGGSGSGPSSSGGAAAAAQTENGVTVIKVGEQPLQMTPNEVTVPAGEMIEFHFYAGAHSVAQSSFDKPCEPLVNGTTVGFFSGPQQVAAGAMGANVFRVKSTGNPMWFYCATQRHCQSGMVGVINKPAARTIAQYAAAAARAPNNVAPAAVGGGDLAAANGATPTGSGPGATDRPNGAGAGFFGQLSMPVLGFAAAVAAIGGLAL